MVKKIKEETFEKSIKIKDSDKTVEIKDAEKPISKTKEKVKKVRVRRQRRLKDKIEHKYIPTHELLTEEEVEKLISQGIDVNKIPLIFISDPAIRYFELKVGDVIKITRQYVISKPYYRMVINDDK